MIKKKKQNYTSDQELLLAKLLEEDMHLDRSFWDSLTPSEKQWAIDSLHTESDSLKLNTLWEYDYKWLPVSIQEAMEANYIDEMGVETNYYFGPDFKQLYPFWKHELGITLSPDSHITEHIATGSIGGGKTTFAVFANAFKLYELSCLRNPHSYYKLMSSAPIVFSLFNVTKERADLSAYTMLKGLVNNAPYFRENFPIDKRRVIDDAADDDLKYAIKLPNNIKIILGSRPNSAISTNVIGGILDEVNFKELKTVKNTEGKIGTQAFQVYTNVLKRIMSRFAADKRKLPGILCNVSSRQSTTDFLEEHIKTIESENANCTCEGLPHICGGKKARIVVASIYKMKPAGMYSSKKFRVQIGNKTIGHKLLLEGQPPAEGSEVEEVPIDFLQAFKDDIDGAIRDICGLATYGNQPFIRDREKVMACVSKTRINPFPASVPLYSEVVKNTEGKYVDVAPSLEDYLHKEVLLQHYGTGYRLRNYPTHQRFVHADLSLTGDCTGFAMGCISEMARVRRQNRDGSVSELVVPKIWIDFMVRIVPTEGYEIDYSKIRQFIYTLRDIYNVPIKQVSTDSFQSSDLRQQLAKEGIDTKIISMDTPRDDNPLAVRMALYEGRVDMPYYDPLLEEIVDLYHDKVKRKVDHRQGKCFTGDTRIPLLNGTTPTLSELSEHGNEVWVYSVTKDGRFVPGKGKAFQSGESDEFVDVIIDTGFVARCTPNHLWMLRDGSYKEAKNLVANVDRLMPMNRGAVFGNQYERVSDKYSARDLTHRLVDAYFNGPLPEGTYVHHVNEDKKDNRPENLQRMSSEEHSRAHTQKRHDSDFDYRFKVANSLQSWNLSDRGREVHRSSILKTMSSMTREDWVKSAKKRKNFRSDITPDVLEWVKEHAEARTANSAARVAGCGRNVIVRLVKEMGFSSWEEFKKAETGDNHRIRAVLPVKLKEPVPIYDLEVNEWDNFALIGGVVVHNSKDVFDSFGGVVCAIGQEEDPDTLIEASSESGQFIMPVEKPAARGTDSFVIQEQVFGDCLTRQND